MAKNKKENEELLSDNNLIEIVQNDKKSMRQGLGKRDNIDGTVMASLPFVGYLLFSLFPMVFSIVISLTELHGYDFTQVRFLWTEGVFHTFDNYINLFRLEYFGTSLTNSLFYALIVPVKLGLQLYVANLLTKRVVGGKFFRVCYFIPTICSTVAVALMWNWIFEVNYGVVNTVIGAVIGGKSPLGLVSSPQEFMPCVWVLSLWWGGCNVILMDSAISAVDVSLKEAARIDGASEFKVFWHVTFPCMTPTLFYHLVMNIISAMQEMSLMQVLSGGKTGPGNMALTMTYYMYHLAFGNDFSIGSMGGMGIGSAFGWFIAIMIIVVTRLQFWLAKKWVNYD